MHVQISSFHSFSSYISRYYKQHFLTLFAATTHLWIAWLFKNQVAFFPSSVCITNSSSQDLTLSMQPLIFQETCSPSSKCAGKGKQKQLAEDWQNLYKLKHFAPSTLIILPPTFFLFLSFHCQWEFCQYLFKEFCLGQAWLLQHILFLLHIMLLICMIQPMSHRLPWRFIEILFCCCAFTLIN